MATIYNCTGEGNSSGTGNRVAHSEDAPVGSLLVMLVVFTGNVNTTMTATDDKGGFWTLIGTALWESSTNIIGVFVRNSRTVSTAVHTISITSGSNTAFRGAVYAITGMTKTGAAAIRQIAYAPNQSSTIPTIAFSETALASNITIATMGSNSSYAFNGIPEEGWTEYQNVGESLPTMGIQSLANEGFSGTTITWEATQSIFGLIALELDTSVTPAYVPDDTAWVEGVPVPIGKRGTAAGDPFNMTIMGPAFRAIADRSEYLYRVMPKIYTGTASGSPLLAHVAGSFNDSLDTATVSGYADVPNCEVGDKVYVSIFFTRAKAFGGNIYLYAKDDNAGTPVPAFVPGANWDANSDCFGEFGGGSDIDFERVPHTMTGMHEVAVRGTSRFSILWNSEAGNASTAAFYVVTVSATHFPAL